MEMNYGLVVYMKDDKTNEVQHFCAYENQPTKADREALMKELETDEGFGLSEEAKAGNLVIEEADEAVVVEYNKLMNS